MSRYYLHAIAICLSLCYLQIICLEDSNLVTVPNNMQATDYSFFNAPLEHVFGDETQSRDVDFSFFNNPYAFEKFNDMPMHAKFSGYVEYVAWWANRIGIGDGNAFEILFPDKPLFDADCRDINAAGEADMKILDTRLRFEFFGPHILGASTFAFIESDVFGFDITEIEFRIWHAFTQLSWEKSKLMLGQFWHPFSVVKTFR